MCPMEYYSAIIKNQFESVLVRWMSPVYRVKSGGKKCHILMHIMYTCIYITAYAYAILMHIQE